MYFAVVAARTDPGTRPRPGLSAIGLGPARLMAISAATTALSCLLGSMLALLLFLHLRGDLTGMPFDGDAAAFLAADRPLPLPAALTLLTLVPVAASLSVALLLRPRETRRVAPRTRRAGGSTAAGAAPVPQQDGTPPHPSPPAQEPDPTSTDPHPLPGPRPTPRELPWGIAVLAAGLAVEAYAGRDTTATGLAMPGGATGSPAAVLVGWTLTALGLALAGPASPTSAGACSRPSAPAPSASSPAASSWRRRPASAARWASSARWHRARTP